MITSRYNTPDEMILRLFVQLSLWLVFTGAVLFLAAGTVNWPAGWAYVALTGGFGLAISLWLARYNPGLLAERMRSLVQREQKPWDRALTVLIAVGFYAWVALMALDASRFGWSRLPASLAPIGAGLIVLCFACAWWVFSVNSFAAPVVKVQAARGHAVITSGPYRLVRHPMYAGAILFFIGVPLLLGSLWGLLGVPILIAALCLRIVGEEHVLRTELDGYDRYAARVRSRLIPGIC
jgi:protein-S-isoprenylcysteine O-methyltransferase Ste14